MNCNAPGCTSQLNWFRRRVLKRPGYDLQSRWFCSEVCLAKGVLLKLEAHETARESTSSVSLQMKLEHVLIGNGLVTRKQLAGRKAGAGLTQHLLDHGYVNERDIILALSRLHNIPVINLTSRRVHTNALNTIPVEIARAHRFFPLEFVSAENCLVLVTSSPASAPVMFSLRAVLDCQLAIYLSPESIVQSMLEQYCELSFRNNNVESESFENIRDAARHISRNAGVIGANSVRVACLDPFIWTRFLAGEEAVNLVLSPASSGLIRDPGRQIPPSMEEPAVQRAEEFAGLA